jgi:hypothetical protein
VMNAVSPAASFEGLSLRSGRCLRPALPLLLTHFFIERGQSSKVRRLAYPDHGPQNTLLHTGIPTSREAAFLLSSGGGPLAQRNGQ